MDKLSFYPDIKKNPRSDSGYGSVADFRKQNKNESTVFKCGKCWITSIGIICIFIGIFLSSCALYVKYAYASYYSLEKMLPHGAIWSLFGFGIALALCAVVLILAACNYQKGICKVILLIFSVTLMVLSLAEILSGVFFVCLLNIPPTANNTIFSDLVQIRQMTVDDIFHECCPYTGNYSLADSICEWPYHSESVEKECDKSGYSGRTSSLNTSIYSCVCREGKDWYGRYITMFFSEKFIWVGGSAIALAVLSLISLIFSCVLLCKKHVRRMDNNLYHDTDFDATHMN